MKRPAHKTLTVRVSAHIAEALSEMLRRCPKVVRRDALLAHWLRGELPKLSAVKPNTESAARFLRRYGRFEEKRRLGVTLPVDLARAITNLCAKRRVSRDAFFERFFEFLVGPTHEGELHVEGSPLSILMEYLNDPWRDAYHIAPAKEGTALSRTNIYQDLHWSEERIKEAKRGVINLDDLMGGQPTGPQNPSGKG